MPHSVCPWWIGYLLLAPWRRLLQSPSKILAPYIRPGMTVLEPGPGMGYFTLELARQVGPSGRVVVVDIQPKMLDALRRRAAQASLENRLDIRLAQPESMGLADLSGKVDFALAFAMVHEIPSASAFFRETAHALKPGGKLLFAEPDGHVKSALFDQELQAAADAGFQLQDRPAIRHSSTALLTRP